MDNNVRTPWSLKLVLTMSAVWLLTIGIVIKNFFKRAWEGSFAQMSDDGWIAFWIFLLMVTLITFIISIA